MFEEDGGTNPPGKEGREGGSGQSPAKERLSKPGHKECRWEDFGSEAFRGTEFPL